MQSEYKITIPKDENNYTHRVCPLCTYRFGMRTGEFPETITCPYCGERSKLSDCNTPEQIEYATEEAKNLIFYEVQKDLQAMMKKSLAGSKNVSFKPGHIQKKYTFPPQQSRIPTEIVCSSCESEYLIFGISALCPYCGCEDVKILDANLALIEKELDSDRGLRQAYGDLVTAFQNVCRFYAVEGSTTNFQNINQSEQYFKNNYHLNLLDNIEATNLSDMRTAFEKRHKEQHTGGIIDQKYVDVLGLDNSLVGQKISYSKDELTSALKALVVVSNNLRTGISK